MDRSRRSPVDGRLYVDPHLHRCEPGDIIRDDDTQACVVCGRLWVLEIGGWRVTPVTPRMPPRWPTSS